MIKRQKSLLLAAFVLTSVSANSFAAMVAGPGVYPQGSIDYGYNNNVITGTPDTSGNVYPNQIDPNGHVVVGHHNTSTFPTGSSHIFGDHNIVDGEHSNAFGGGNVGKGNLAQLIGDQNTVNGDRSNGYGVLNTVTGNNSSAVGTKNVIDGDASIAVGIDNLVNTPSSEAVGDANKITSSDGTGFSNAAFGGGNIIDGSVNTAVGEVNTITGEASNAFGYRNTVNGDKSTATGSRNEVNETSKDGTSNVFGDFNVTNGENNTAIGSNNKLTGIVNNAVGESNTVTGNYNDVLGSGVVVNAENSVTLGNGSTNTRNYTVSVGSEGQERQITNVAAGTKGTDAVNVNQLTASIESLTNNGLNFSGTTGTGHSNLGDTVSVLGGNSNIRTIVTDNSIQINLADDLNVNSITTNELKINGESYITPEGLNANNKPIINVADGVNPTDAVNKRQLDNEINSLKGSMDQGFKKVNKRISDVGANSAALAGLHPVDFDPDYKFNVAAAYGHYEGSDAAAIGAFYRPNENIMFSTGVTLSDETMFNVGVSAKFGSSSAKYNNYRNYKSDMDKMARDYDKRLADMQKELDAMKAKNTVFDNLRASFPDVPADHWANEAVEVLHGNGVLEGYPDGEFKGNKSMTRYEYAEMLYRAMERGNKVPQSMIDEYKPELDQVKAAQKNSSGSDIKVTRETANTSVTPESVGLNAEKLDAMVKSANQNADKPIVLMSNGNAEMAKKAMVIRDYLKSHGVKNTILLDGKVF